MLPLKSVAHDSCNCPPRVCRICVLLTHMSVRPIGVKFCIVVQLCPGRDFCPFYGDIFSGLQMGGQMFLDNLGPLRHVQSFIIFKQCKIDSYYLRRKCVCKALSKNVWHGALAPETVFQVIRPHF